MTWHCLAQAEVKELQATTTAATTTATTTPTAATTIMAWAEVEGLQPTSIDWAGSGRTTPSRSLLENTALVFARLRVKDAIE